MRHSRGSSLLRASQNAEYDQAACGVCCSGGIPVWSVRISVGIQRLRIPALDVIGARNTEACHERDCEKGDVYWQCQESLRIVRRVGPSV